MDRELADALAGELPAAATANAQPVAVQNCPDNSRGAGYELEDGFMTIVVTPDDHRKHGPGRLSDGTQTFTVATKTHRLLIISTKNKAKTSTESYEDEMQKTATKLSSNF
ncbi:hypothetical protein D5S17_18055 [Pseudonocardiaceae bacterium YIM PH 21723]|nr:hypothetical protein D5S17_18055 [Pseudonocardiaceae bacterium YIM PH 21723]